MALRSTLPANGPATGPSLEGLDLDAPRWSRAAPSWKRKLAVVLLVALLCIAFAGLIWAIIL